MSVFEKATRTKMRVQTDRGNLGVEDLWDLSLTALNKVAKRLNKELKQNAEEDFLEEASSEDIATKLKFDVVIYILTVKKEEKKAKAEASTKRAEKERLMTILERKQHEADEELSEEELKKKIAELG